VFQEASAKCFLNCQNMSSIQDKIQIFPSAGALTYIKGRITSASKGKSLLKRKADALQMRFKSILG